MTDILDFESLPVLSLFEQPAGTWWKIFYVDVFKSVLYLENLDTKERHKIAVYPNRSLAIKLSKIMSEYSMNHPVGIEMGIVAIKGRHETKTVQMRLPPQLPMEELSGRDRNVFMNMQE